MLGFFEPTGVAPARPGRPGLLWQALLLPALPLLAVAGSGIPRVLLGVELGLGLAASTVAGVALAVFIARAARPGRGPPGLLLAAGAFLAFACALTFATLYNRWFEGLPSVGGGDAGQHVALRRLFLTVQPDAYYKFITSYALTAWIERAFGVGPFESYRLTFYAGAVMLWACIAAAFALLAQEGPLPRPRLRAQLFVLCVAFAGVAVFVLLPLLHYHQADGFYPHLFGLIPLFGVWVLQAGARARAVRLASLGFLIVFQRFTYGLNLGDLLLAAAAMWLLEARALSGRARRIVQLGAVAFVAGAVFAYAQLLPLIASMPGGVVPHRSALVGAFQLFLALVLVASCAVARRLQVPLGDSGERLALFAGSVGGLGGLVPLVFHAASLPIYYYLYKYSLHGLMLLLAAWVVCLAEVIPRCLEREVAGGLRRRGFAGVLALAMCVSTIFLARGFPGQWRSFVERVRGGPPWTRLMPFADREGWRRIEATLASTHGSFGGLLSSSWPLTMFMNAGFGFWEDWPQYETSKLLPGPGRCWFWYPQPDPFTPEGEPVPAHLREVTAKLDAEPGKTCESYRARWDPGFELRLCHVCK